MDFAEWIREQATKTYTENGAAARNTTGDARLDLFATIGSHTPVLDAASVSLVWAGAPEAQPANAAPLAIVAPAPNAALTKLRRVTSMIPLLNRNAFSPFGCFSKGL